MKITILGCGVYGMALATSFLKNKVTITMWNKFEKEIEKLKENYNSIQFTTNLEKAIKNTDLIVIAIPIAFLEETIKELKKYYKKEDILIASKGIDTKTTLFAYEIIENHLNNASIGVISGGTFAVDMMNQKVMGLTLGTKSKSIQNKVKQSLESSFLKIQYTDDIIGTSVCGAIKNVMAIGFGMLDGAEYPESSRFLFLTEAIYEIQNLIEKLNGNLNSIMKYAGIDDIMMTCTSSKSRNYTLGKMIGEQKTKEEIEQYKQTTTIEGLGTSKAIYELSKKKNITLPISQIIYEILYKEKTLNHLITYLEKKET